MSFLSWPIALVAAGITVPALVALYFLKLRRRVMAVPSTLLWKRAIQDMQVNAPFQKLRKNLLLLLQLLILAALLLAMARPAMDATAEPGQRVVILLDHSASMNATDVPGGRLEEAKETARRLIENLGTDGAAEAMVMSFAERARVVQPFTGDLARLRAAVDRVTATDQRSRIAPALQLIEPFALETEATEGEPLAVYVISDGRVVDATEDDGGPALSLRGADMRFVQIGSPQDAPPRNVGVVSFAARRDFEKPQLVRVFARLANYGPEAVTTNLELRVAGRVLRVQPTELPAATAQGSGSRSVQFEFVLPDSALVELEHDVDDVLPADDRAALMLAPARRMRVLLVSTGNAFLERVLQSVGVRDVVLMSPTKFETQLPETLSRGGWDAGAAPSEGFDVIVFDDYAPQTIPRVSSLYLGAAPPIEGLEIRPGSESAPAVQPILDWARQDPVLRYVVLDDVAVQDPGRIVVPEDGEVLATGQSGPVMARVSHDGVQHVVTSFGVLQSNWPLYISFPVFISNAVQSLGLGALADEAGLAYSTGSIAVVPLDAAGNPPTYIGPATLKANVMQGSAVLPAFTQAGIYEAQGDVEAPFDVLPVNLLDAVESDLRPVDRLEVATVDVSGQAEAATIRREVWPWFAWAALAVLLIEWLVYTRRMHL